MIFHGCLRRRRENKSVLCPFAELKISNLPPSRWSLMSITVQQAWSYNIQLGQSNPHDCKLHYCSWKKAKRDAKHHGDLTRCDNERKKCWKQFKGRRDIITYLSSLQLKEMLKINCSPKSPSSLPPPSFLSASHLFFAFKYLPAGVLFWALWSFSGGQNVFIINSRRSHLLFLWQLRTKGDRNGGRGGGGWGLWQRSNRPQIEEGVGGEFGWNVR